MVKKTIIILVIVVLVFVAMVYVSVSSTSKKFSTCVLTDTAQFATLNFREHDSVALRASVLYRADEFKEFMQGEQYRAAWSAEVTVPVVFLDTLKGGLRVIEEGGGKQTQSLELEDSLGIRYTLRSINKNPKKLIPGFAESLGLENIVVDGISAQHPYAAPVVAKLADAIGVLHTDPKVYFIPQQKSLENFNEKYGNRLFLFEYETESKTNWTDLDDIVEIVDTDDLQELKLEYPDSVVIDENLMVRSRLLDIVIGDWDRHAKQWGWALQKTKSKLTAIPLPCDRDNAFFNVEGVIPTILSNKNMFPGMQAFEKEVKYMPGLIMPFDRYFLLQTSKEIYIEQAQHITSTLTNEAIENAFRAWDTSIYDLDAEEIIAKVKYRRDHLVPYAEKFHDFLQSKGPLNEPLKGSEDITLPQEMISCFDCEL